ncbi:MAG TPA: alginate lyase family protein [Pyrinomonadaceae bacterium]|nr:alginate lyase family protein [Pyrinomonadaceae bacterium]
MSSFTTKIKKLKGLKMDEISVRVAQRVAILSERSGWSRHVNLASDEQLLALLSTPSNSTSALVEHLRTRTEPRFFASFDAKEQTVSELRRRWPEAEKEILDAANRVSEGTFSLLGLRDLKLGPNIDWHLEPMSGKRTPLCHWSQLNYLNANIAGDKKITWELNRHQYFVTLGRAYWLTGDEHYAEIFVSHITSWMDQNPPKLGINWASSLEVAFRSISWLWALQFFKESRSLSSPVVVRMLKFLYLNALHLKTYLSTYFSPNTHLTGEALGLFYIGLLLPEFKDAERWRELGLEILVSQLPRHVKPDGVYFEQSSYYHRYTTDFYIHLAVLLRNNRMTLPSELEPKLERLLDHLMYITRPDGATPFFGDDDGGRLVMLDQRPANDFRSLLSTGAALFNRPDYKFVAGAAAEETLWLLGADGLSKFDHIDAREPGKQSVAFRDGGYYVMRDGWSSTANYLLFDCGPHGMANCGHAHADALAIELAARGRTLLVDPGTFTYTGGKEMRDWFRSSVAHNTLTVDRESSSIPADTFSWKTVTHCERVAWIDHARFTYVSGKHSGYEHLAKPGIHTRSILFLKRDYWIMRDRVELSGKHQLDLWYHFDSGTSPTLKGASPKQWVHENGATGGLQIISFAAGGSWTKEEGWVSHCYGERAPAEVCVFSAPGEGSSDEIEITTFLLPEFAGTPASVEEIEVSGGLGFEVLNENSRDVVIIRNRGDAGVAQTASVISDFEYTWLRFEGNSETPAELVLLGGKKLAIAGQRIIESRERVEYSCSRRNAR